MSYGSVPTLVKTFGSATGPGLSVACQPMTTMPASFACWISVLLFSIETEPRMMRVGLQRDRLGERVGAAGRGALAVHQRELPAEHLGRFLRAARRVGVAARVLGQRDVDDRLVLGRLRAGGRAVPGGLRADRAGDVGLHAVEHRVVGEAGAVHDARRPRGRGGAGDADASCMSCHVRTSSLLISMRLESARFCRLASQRFRRRAA